MSKWYKHSFILAVFLMMSLLFLQGCGSSGFMLGSSKQQQYIPSETPYTKYMLLKTQSPSDHSLERVHCYLVPWPE